MASPVNPLDFERIISYAVGDATLFIYLFIIAMSIYAAKMRIPVGAYLMLMFVFVVIMYFAIGWTGAIIIFIIAAVFLGYNVAKFIKQ